MFFGEGSDTMAEAEAEHLAAPAERMHYDECTVFETGECCCEDVENEGRQ